MTAPKGAIENPFAANAAKPGETYKEMVEGVRLPGEDPKAVEAAAKKKENDGMNAMLRAQNGDKPIAPKPAPKPAPVAEVVVEAVKAKVTFDAELKKEMLDLVMANSLQVDEVTDTKIVFTKDNRQFVIIPI